MGTKLYPNLKDFYNSTTIGYAGQPNGKLYPQIPDSITPITKDHFVSSIHMKDFFGSDTAEANILISEDPIYENINKMVEAKDKDIRKAPTAPPLEDTSSCFQLYIDQVEETLSALLDATPARDYSQSASSSCSLAACLQGVVNTSWTDSMAPDYDTSDDLDVHDLLDELSLSQPPDYETILRDSGANVGRAKFPESYEAKAGVAPKYHKITWQPHTTNKDMPQHPNRKHAYDLKTHHAHAAKTKAHASNAKQNQPDGAKPAGAISNARPTRSENAKNVPAVTAKEAQRTTSKPALTPETANHPVQQSRKDLHGKSSRVDNHEYKAWITWRKQVNRQLATVILLRRRECHRVDEGDLARKPLSARSMEVILEGVKRRDTGCTCTTSLGGKPYIMYGIPRASLCRGF